MKRWSVTGSVLVVMLGLLACSKPAAPVASDRAAATTGRVFHMQLGAEPEYLDPSMMSETEGSRVGRALFEGLTRYDAKTTDPRPGVAERWEISADQRTYMFHLRPTARWSDGLPVTAQDFVYAWERVLNPATGSKAAYLMFVVRNAQAYQQGTLTDAAQLGIRAVDAHTLQVTLEHPTPYFLQLLRYPIFSPLRRDVIEQFGPRWTRAEHMVSNGPFQLIHWTPQKIIRVQKNPHYWKAAQVKLPGIDFHVVEDNGTAVKMYDAGELDVAWYLPDAQLPTLRGRPDFVMHASLANYYYNLNVEKPPLTDRRVRQALSQAIDRQTLCDKYLQGTKVPAVHLVPPGIAGYTPASGAGFDPAAAQRLLAEAGFPGGKGFPALTIRYNTDDRHKLVAQVIQQMWKQHLGITVQLQNEEWKSHLKTLQAGGYEIGRGGWVGDYPDPLTFLEMYSVQSTQNYPRWHHAEFDRLLQQAAQETQAPKRLALLQQAEALLVQELPVIPIYMNTRLYLKKPDVTGFEPHVEEVQSWEDVGLASQ